MLLRKKGSVGGRGAAGCDVGRGLVEREYNCLVKEKKNPPTRKKSQQRDY